jgi:serine phosphatase RsbU (regulator of sigma subunit)
MLSSLAIGFLNYVVYSKDFENIGDILNEIDKKWIETFNHNEEEEVNNDWMEISLVAFNPITQELQFAGAGGSILLMDENKHAIRLKGNHYPIGGWQIELHRKFYTERLKLKGGEKVYLFSDGYKDQFGGTYEKRMGIKQFCRLISRTSDLTCVQQKRLMEEEFALWKGNNEQTDDVCLLRIDL